MTNQTNNQEKLNDLVKEAQENDVQINIWAGKQTIKPNEQFAMVFYASFNDIIKNYRLTATDLMVLFQVLHYVNFGNLISLTQETIANDLGFTQPQVNRCYKKLKEAKIFYQHKKSLFINPRYLVKGSLKSAKESDVYKKVKSEMYDELKTNIKDDEELTKAVNSKLPF